MNSMHTFVQLCKECTGELNAYTIRLLKVNENLITFPFSTSFVNMMIIRQFS